MTEIYKEEAWAHYKKARYISKKHGNKLALQSLKHEIDAVQLGLALNYAVFLYEVVGSADQKKYALRLLKKVQKRALDDFDQWKK